jgi:hypothetical protein
VASQFPLFLLVTQCLILLRLFRSIRLLNDDAAVVGAPESNLAAGPILEWSRTDFGIVTWSLLVTVVAITPLPGIARL